MGGGSSSSQGMRQFGRAAEGFLYRNDPRAYQYEGRPAQKRSAADLDSAIQAMHDEDLMTDEEWAEALMSGDTERATSDAAGAVDNSVEDAEAVDEELNQDRKDYWTPKLKANYSGGSKGGGGYGGFAGGGYSSPIAMGGGGGNSILQNYIQAVLGRGPATWG